MAYIYTPTWEIEVAAQGDHSTPVNTQGIRELLQDAAQSVFLPFLSDYQQVEKRAFDCQVVATAFFDRGSWLLNVERKRLVGSNHYHSGTIRIYEEVGYNGVRIVVHTHDGERRYGHLHPPKEMSRKEARESLTALQLCFSKPINNELREAQEDFDKSYDRIKGFSAPLSVVGPTDQFIIKSMRHAHTILRSKEKQLSFAQHLWAVTDNGTAPLTAETLERVMRAHWAKFRKDGRIEYNDVLTFSILSQALTSQLLVEPAGADLEIGELAEILINDQLAKEAAAAELQRHRKVAETEKEIESLEAQLERLRSETDAAEKKLGCAKSRLAELTAL